MSLDSDDLYCFVKDFQDKINENNKTEYITRCDYNVVIVSVPYTWYISRDNYFNLKNFM